MNLEELLRACQARHIILLLNRRGQVSLWSPNTRVPTEIRAAICAYLKLMERSWPGADSLMEVCMT